jgi:hypothetical protein
VRSIEEWQFGEITDSPGAEMEDDEYVLIKAMIELIPVQAERDQSTEGPIETDEPIGQPVGEPVLNPRQELTPVPQGIRTLLIQSTARPGYVREHDLQPNELFLGVRMRRTPIKEEPEEGEIAHTPPPWKYSIHSILTRSVQAPCAIKTERLSPGETFAGFKMPGLVSPSLDSSPIDFAMRREMRMISNYSSRDDSDASEVEFDSYDSFLDDEFSEDEDDFHESETERQPSKFLIFPPRVQRRLEIPLRPTNGTLVDTVEKDEVYVLMRMNDDPIKSEEYDEPSKKWPPDFRVVRARNGKPLHNIRQRTFLIDDEVYIRAAAQPPIKFERFTSLPPLPSHSWASPSRIPTLPPFPPPRPPVSINLMGQRSVMPWPRSTSLVPQHRATSSAPDARLPGPPGSPRNY